MISLREGTYPGKYSTLQATGVCGGGGRRVAGARQDYEKCDCGTRGY